MSITAPSCESLGEGRVVGRRMAGALVVGALVAGALVAGVHVVVALTHGGPVAVPDVSAYLSVAQWVGGAGLAPEGLQFHPGYGLLLAPVVGVLGADGQGLHTAALILNAIAAGAVVMVAVWLAVLCLGFHVVGANTGGAVGANAHPPRPVLWLVAGLAALHPSVTAASRIAWPETLLTLLTLGIALCLAAASQAPAQVATSRWVGSRRMLMGRWVGSRRMLMGSAGAASGLTFLLHPRAVVLSLALCVVVVALRWARMEWRSTLSGLTVGWVLSVVTLVVTDTWPSRRLGAAASLKNGVEPIGAMAGQLIALAAGTIGLALVGLAVGTRVLQVAATSRRAARDAVGGGAAQGAVGGSARDAVGSSALGVVAVFYTVGASATIVLGGWVLTGSSRADTLLYGRYIDPWAIGLSLVAICAVSGSRLVVVFGSVWSGRLVAFGSVLAAAAVVFVGAGDEAVREPARRIMTLSTSLVWSLVGDRSVRSAVLVATAVAVAGVALTVACARTDWRSRSRERRQSPLILSGRAVPVGGMSGRAVLGLLALALFVGATVSNHRHLAQIGAVARGQVVTAELATRLAANNGVDCLAHDADTLPNYALWLYKLEAPQLRHEQVSFSAGQTACGPLVVATEEIKLWCDGVAQLATEPAAKWGLWRLPESSGCMA